jgi:hypothetical protein
MSGGLGRKLKQLASASPLVSMFRVTYIQFIFDRLNNVFELLDLHEPVHVN